MGTNTVKPRSRMASCSSNSFFWVATSSPASVPHLSFEASAIRAGNRMKEIRTHLGIMPIPGWPIPGDTHDRIRIDLTSNSDSAHWLSAYSVLGDNLMPLCPEFVRHYLSTRTTLKSHLDNSYLNCNRYSKNFLTSTYLALLKARFLEAATRYDNGTLRWQRRFALFERSRASWTITSNKYKIQGEAYLRSTYWKTNSMKRTRNTIDRSLGLLI